MIIQWGHIPRDIISMKLGTILILFTTICLVPIECWAHGKCAWNELNEWNQTQTFFWKKLHEYPFMRNYPLLCCLSSTHTKVGFFLLPVMEANSSSLVFFSDTYICKWYINAYIQMIYKCIYINDKKKRSCSKEKYTLMKE